MDLTYLALALYDAVKKAVKEAGIETSEELEQFLKERQSA